MMKIVPDPPRCAPYKTASLPFGSCDAGHPPLFSVNEGISAEDALVHASLQLKAGIDAVNQTCFCHERTPEGLRWASLHAMEAAKALIDALLDGFEAQAMKR
ncbi:DUF3077 domain-containing protein [Pseudomonas sp. FFUP_PS_473]|jgi:hypothetical protein|uniref:DUF3077 domain-containing protein n=1 Tax=Pseudomonas TaxID=286 RepID=UPI00081160F1|nr:MULTISPECIES: DUF3077 domain-containing protein [Pseudomonas]ATR84551.1 DUF3077 domain-containing protein [Pseudomonas sp. HLS-6]MEE3635546.1 DUF3077 domain-containing protein [Pseudomonas sp. AL 58]PLP92383.1 DUF3077 domain-containing protein [Pseudomonas sp. FFUP_PS_473]WJM96551.1 DUF3077 domain-containing protein [Pseudomonas defluvii]